MTLILSVDQSAFTQYHQDKEERREEEERGEEIRRGDTYTRPGPWSHMFENFSLVIFCMFLIVK